MLRKSININNYKFVCDYLYNDELPGINEDSFSIARSLSYVDILDDNEFFVFQDSDDIVYPIVSEIERYSKDPSRFMPISTNIEYDFYDSSLEKKNLKYDVVRIYHPDSFTSKFKFIVHLYTVVNGKKFHIFCKEYSDIQNYTSKEFTIDNSTYSEYVEFKIPNLQDMFSKETFTLENVLRISADSKGYIKEDENKNTYYSLFLHNFSYIFNDVLIDSNGIKTFMTKSTDVQISYPINITIYPYSIIDNNDYIIDEELVPNSDSFYFNSELSLYSQLKFNEIGKLQLYSSFTHNDNISVTEAYEKINNVSFADYDGIIYDEEDENEDYTIDGDLLEKQYQIAYVIEYASDAEFKNIIYRSKFVEGMTLFDDVQERYFDIPVFSKWEQKPEILVARVTFIDRYLGKALTSNITVITDEYYKYLVNYDDRKIYSIDFTAMNDKFIDKVTCVVKKESNNRQISMQSSAPKVVFKPVFYKVQDLQNIQLYQGVTQNVGINLSNYMTKVEAFIMIIDGQKILEYSRNDIYVIFKVQANKLTSTSGTYHICNQDEEYITSGSWNLI